MPSRGCRLLRGALRCAIACGHSGHGVEAARVSGGLGMISNLVDALRALAMAGAQAVGAGVAAADDENALAFREDRDRGIDRIALAAAILLRQKLHREMNALQLAAGNRQVARMLGAAAKQNRVVLVGERFDRDIHADVRVGDKRHALGAHLLRGGDRRRAFPA